MTDEFTKERIAEWRNDSGPWTDTDIGFAMDAIERRDQRIAELESFLAEYEHVGPQPTIYTLIQERDSALDRIDVLNRRHEEDEAYRVKADGERDAALARVGELEAEVSSLWDSLDIAVKRHDTELFTAHANGIEAAAKHVEAHSCVASCCHANPSSSEARQLAACIRNAASRNGPLIRAATGSAGGEAPP